MIDPVGARGLTPSSNASRTGTEPKGFRVATMTLIVAKSEAYCIVMLVLTVAGEGGQGGARKICRAT